MNRLMRYQTSRLVALFSIPIILLGSCDSAPSDDHGHSHAGDLRSDTTMYQNGLELFIEYPAMVQGELGTFAAHLTRLSDHSPVTDGSITVSMLAGKKGIRNTVQASAQAGIFTPALRPNNSGEARLILDYKAGTKAVRFDLGIISVYESFTAAEEQEGAGLEMASEIELTKEAAWKMGLQTQVVVIDSLFGSYRAVGKWLSTPAEKQHINAPAQGRVLFVKPQVTRGMLVQKGQVLWRLSGAGQNTSNIDVAIKQAQIELDQLKSAYDRKKKLHQKQVVSDADWELAEKAYRQAQANYQSLLQNYDSQGIAIRATESGLIYSLEVENGTLVEAGDHLAIIGPIANNHIEAQIPAELSSKLMTSTAISLYENGQLQEQALTIVARSTQLAAGQALVPFLLKSAGKGEAIGGKMVEVQFGYPLQRLGISIPKSALLEEFGRYSVIVQLSGESYESRLVEIEVFNGDHVVLRSGLNAGERIVTKAAYQVKMSALSDAAPSHGHAH
jgi:cobalt-zinc-cadmium efflux system membrane fusion protein